MTTDPDARLIAEIDRLDAVLVNGKWPSGVILSRHERKVVRKNRDHLVGTLDALRFHRKRDPR